MGNSTVRDATESVKFRCDSEDQRAIMFAARVLASASRTRAVSAPRSRDVVTLISGKPGGGKGTLCKKLIKDFDCHHISTGDILRRHVADQTPIGVKAKSFMESGQMVPVELVIDLVFDELDQIDLPNSIVLLDGFPRSTEQADLFLARQNIDIALDVTVPNEEIVKRASMRWVHPGSGRVYAYDYNPPKEEGKDDETGEPLVQRDDDKPETVLERLKVYEETTRPLAELFTERGVYAAFDGASQPELLAANKRSDAIYAEMKPHFEAELKTFGL